MMYNKIEYRGLVKWYDRGLQNLWRGFDSLIPWFKKRSTGNFAYSKDSGASLILQK